VFQTIVFGTWFLSSGLGSERESNKCKALHKMSILISSSCRVLVSSSQLLNYDANDRTATDPYDANGKNVTVLQALKNIATNNLVNAAFPNGLVHVFQQASQFPIAYDEDNSEDYKGLEDFGNFLNSIDDSSASTYLNAAANIASGMQQTYTNNVYNGTTTNHNYLNLPGFLNAWQEDSGFTGPLPMSNPSPTFYPDGASQIFPQAYRVFVPSSMYAGGWTFVRSTFDFESPSVSSSDPWTIIGLAATYNGDNNTANAMLSKTRNWGGPPINDWGFYRRIALYEIYGFIY